METSNIEKWNDGNGTGTLLSYVGSRQQFGVMLAIKDKEPVDAVECLLRIFEQYTSSAAVSEHMDCVSEKHFDFLNKALCCLHYSEDTAFSREFGDAYEAKLALYLNRINFAISKNISLLTKTGQGVMLAVVRAWLSAKDQKLENVLFSHLIDVVKLMDPKQVPGGMKVLKSETDITYLKCSYGGFSIADLMQKIERQLYENLDMWELARYIDNVAELAKTLFGFVFDKKRTNGEFGEMFRVGASFLALDNDARGRMRTTLLRLPNRKDPLVSALHTLLSLPHDQLHECTVMAATEQVRRIDISAACSRMHDRHDFAVQKPEVSFVFVGSARTIRVLYTVVIEDRIPQQHDEFIKSLVSELQKLKASIQDVYHYWKLDFSVKSFSGLSQQTLFENKSFI